MIAPTSAVAREPRITRRLATGFAALAGLSYGLIVLGALVRAHHAGLACPDWPLCFGVLVPEFNLQVAFEWSHRLVAGSLSIAFAILTFVCLRQRLEAGRGPLRWLLATAAALLALQIVLGGLTVLHLLASWTVTAHLVTGNAFALCLALTAQHLFELSQPAADRRLPIPVALRAAVTACAGLMIVQLVLGGLVSSNYAGLACSEWPTCEDGHWLPSWKGAQGLHLLHRFNAYGLALAIAATCIASRRTAVGPLARLLRLALALVLLQIAVGVADVLLALPPEVTGLHTGLAALLGLSLGLAVRESWRGPLASSQHGVHAVPVLHPCD